MIAWGQQHPEFARHLEDFGKARFDRIERITQDTQEKDYERDNGESERRILYRLAWPAVDLAAELNPISTVAPRLLAIIDEEDELYDSAYERISRLIDALGVSGHDKKELYKATTLRARLARRLADAKRQGDSRVACQALLVLMEQAVEDLRLSEQYVTTHRDDGNTHFVERTLYVLDIKAPAFLTLSEIETNLGRIPEAKEHLRVALEAFDRIEELRPVSAKYTHLWDLPRYRERAAYLLQRLFLPTAFRETPRLPL